MHKREKNKVSGMSVFTDLFLLRATGCVVEAAGACFWFFIPLRILSVRVFAVFWRFASEDRDHILNRDDIQLIIGLEVDRDCVLRVEQDFVVLA